MKRDIVLSLIVFSLLSMLVVALYFVLSDKYREEIVLRDTVILNTFDKMCLDNMYGQIARYIIYDDNTTVLYCEDGTISFNVDKEYYRITG